MKRLFFSLLMILMIATQVQASSLIVYGGNLSDEDKIAIDGLLREYTGPAAAHFIKNPTAVNDPQFALLFSDEPFAEEKFMRNMLQEKYPSVKVEAIPTTLWDTTVARLWLTDQSTHDRYNQIGSLQGAKKVKKEHVLRYFDIAAEIGKQIDTEGQKHDKFKSMIIDNLRLIKENAIPLGNADYVNSLTHEYDNIIGGKTSLLLELVDEEYEAALNNKFMIIRATNGGRMAVALDPSLKESVLSHENKWQYSDKDNRKIIDFQTHSIGDSVFENIGRLERDIKDPNLTEIDTWHYTKDFSYATSLLGGVLYDSFNRTQSASSFVYYAKGATNIVYTLMLDKKWTFGLGRNMFYFMHNGLYTDAIFGSQEAFHPRMLSVTTITDENAFDKKSSNYLGVYSNKIGLDPNFPYGEFDVRANDEALRKATIIILQQLVRNTEFLTHARIMALGKNVFNKPNETAEAQELIANQKLVLETLLEHIRK
jgi:hypothetical protein